MANTRVKLLASVSLAWLSLAGAADPPARQITAQSQASLPITLDADSSEFDRQHDKLTFHGLRITQGNLGIQADAAQANRIDFEDSLWVFTGHVVIDSDGTIANCDNAEIVFQDHRLRSAVLRGNPASFEQRQRDNGKVTRGHAGLMEYDVDAGIIRMSGNAWVSDGANEVTGAKITYDLKKEYIIADSDGSGQVRMKIKPPEKKGKIEEPGP